MNRKEMFNKWKAFVNAMNARGVPMPLIRDPRTSRGSVSLTLVFLSSLWVQIGLLNKFANLFQGINLDEALQFFYACCALYFGRSWSGKDSTIGADDSEDKDKS